MTTANAAIDFIYKVGVTDDAPCRLTQSDGTPIDLTSYDSILFNANDGEGHSFSITCSKGNATYSASQGGVTVHFTDTELAVIGEYECEFVASLSGALTRFPSDNNYFVLAIYHAVETT